MNQNLFIRKCQLQWSQIPKDSYLNSISSLTNTTSLTFTSAVTYFSGENGSGKSTLLEAIALCYGFNPEGGTRNYSFSTNDTHSELYQHLQLIKGTKKLRWGYFLRAESFYNVATKEEEYARDSRSISEQLHMKSHGESFLSIAKKHFQPNGLFILDEPEAALSPQRQLTLLKLIDDCSKAGSQFLIATHSPILLALPGAEILNFDEQGIHPVTYEETDSYQITEMFLLHRESMLKHLLEESETNS